LRAEKVVLLPLLGGVIAAIIYLVGALNQQCGFLRSSYAAVAGSIGSMI
jgi:hypothetical protein